MSDTRILYDEDFFAWTKQQARALRAAAKAGSNLRVDWANLAEEIEDLGKSERRELGSRIREIVEHLVKLQYSPSTGPRAGWRSSIRRQRVEIEDLLKDSPSLRRQLAPIVRDQTIRGSRHALADLQDRGELPRSGVSSAEQSDPDHLSYTIEQILGDWFPSDPEPEPARRRR